MVEGKKRGNTNWVSTKIFLISDYCGYENKISSCASNVLKINCLCQFKLFFFFYFSHALAPGVSNSHRVQNCTLWNSLKEKKKKMFRIYQRTFQMNLNKFCYHTEYGTSRVYYNAIGSLILHTCKLNNKIK